MSLGRKKKNQCLTYRSQHSSPTHAMTAHTGDQPQTTAVIGMQDQMREEFINVIYESQ